MSDYVVWARRWQGAPRPFLAAAMLLALGGGANADAAAPARRFEVPGQDRPNILMLFADDLTHRGVGAAGALPVKTPYIDRLASRGVWFTDCSIQGGLSGAVCVASRAMLHTGRYLWRCGPNGDGRAPGGRDLLPLWGQTLAAAGYQTFAVGKWHNGKPFLDAGFETTEPTVLGGMLESTPTNGPAYDRPAPGNPWAPDDPKWDGHWLQNEDGSIAHSSERWADAAIADLEAAARDPRPFFLYVAFHAPHDPRQAPRACLDMYPPESLTVPPNFLPRHPFDLGEFRTRDELLAPYPRTQSVVQVHLHEYYAIISHLDAQIGRILEALERTGQADDTLVVFAADNGLAVGQHGLLGKQCLYEHSIRVPLIIAGPGVPAGKRIDAMVYLASLFATTCEMAGAPTPPTVEFPSLAGLVAGQTDRPPHEDVYAAYINRQRMVRTKRWKLILTPDANLVQLFDLENDPWEQRSEARSPQAATLVPDLMTRLKRWMAVTGDPMPPARLDATLEAFRLASP